MDDITRTLIINGIVIELTGNDRIANVTEVMEYMSNPDNDLNRIALITDSVIKMKVVECCVCCRLLVACNCKIIIDIKDSKKYCIECRIHVLYNRRHTINIEELFR